MFYALSMLLYKILFILPHELSPVMLDNEYERKGVSTLSISHMQRNLSHICTIDLTPKTRWVTIPHRQSSKGCGLAHLDKLSSVRSDHSANLEFSIACQSLRQLSNLVCPGVIYATQWQIRVKHRGASSAEEKAKSRKHQEESKGVKQKNARIDKSTTSTLACRNVPKGKGQIQRAG